MSSRYIFDVKPRCIVCNKLLAERVTRPWTIGCGRCKHQNYSEDKRPDRLIVIETDDGYGFVDD